MQYGSHSSNTGSSASIGNASTAMSFGSHYSIMCSFIFHLIFNRKCNHRWCWYMTNKRREDTAMWHMVPITPTWAVSHFAHAQMFFNRKCKHFYNIRFPLLRRLQFHLSCMSRTSIGHVTTVHVDIIYIYGDDKGGRGHPYKMWFPLLQRGQFHLSCTLICHEPVYCTWYKDTVAVATASDSW